MANVVPGPGTGEGQVGQMQTRLSILGGITARVKVLQWVAGWPATPWLAPAAAVQHGPAELPQSQGHGEALLLSGAPTRQREP